MKINPKLIIIVIDMGENRCLTIADVRENVDHSETIMIVLSFFLDTIISQLILIRL